MPQKIAELPSSEASGVAAVDRALSILACFSAEEDGLGLADIAARTGIYKSTILRLIQSLMRARMLLRLGDGRYRIGPEALRLGWIYQQAYKVGDVVVPVMRELCDLTQESVVFYVREGERRVALHRVESHQAIHYHVREGDTLPLSAGSGGRVLTAFAGAQGDLHDRIRSQMHYASYGERNPDTSGVSAPVFGPHQVLAGALTIAGPTTRITKHFVHEHLKDLFAASLRISRDLGASPSLLAALSGGPGRARQARIREIS